MKKKILFLLPLISLVACSGEAPETFKPYLDYKSVVPTMHLDESDHTTYLMMSPYGTLDFEGAPIKGKVSDKFYENTIIWKAEAGSELPTGTKVKSTVNGATFRGWAYYDEDNTNVFPDYYTTVPNKNGVALKAIFDGTDAGGSGGGGGITTAKYGLIFSDGTKVAGTPKGISAYGKDEYLMANVKFVAGSSFAMYDYSTTASWITTVNSYSFGGTSDTDQTWKNYISATASYWTVVQNFTADVYIQLQYQNDSIYFGLVK